MRKHSHPATSARGAALPGRNAGLLPAVQPLPGGLTSGWGMAAATKPSLNPPGPTSPISCWKFQVTVQWHQRDARSSFSNSVGETSLPAHPSRSSPHLLSLSINLVVHLPPGLSLHLAKFPIPAARRHVVRDAKPSRSSSGIQVSAERTSPLEGQWNISSPAISRKTDGSTGGREEGACGWVEEEERRLSSPPWAWCCAQSVHECGQYLPHL